MHVMVEEHNSMTQTAGFPTSSGGTVKMETYQAERITHVTKQSNTEDKAINTVLSKGGKYL